MLVGQKSRRQSRVTLELFDPIVGWLDWQSTRVDPDWLVWRQYINSDCNRWPWGQILTSSILPCLYKVKGVEMIRAASAQPDSPLVLDAFTSILFIQKAECQMFYIETENAAQFYVLTQHIWHFHIVTVTLGWEKEASSPVCYLGFFCLFVYIILVWRLVHGKKESMHSCIHCFNWEHFKYLAFFQCIYFLH